MDKGKQYAKLSSLGMILVTLIWGLGFPITQIALDNGLNTFTITFVRFFVGFVFLSLIFYKRLRLINYKYIYAGFITSIFLFIAYYFQTEGLVYTTPSKNAFLTQVCVIMIPFISWSLFKVKPDKYTFFSAITTIIGMFVLVGGISGRFNLGDFLTIVGALAISLNIISLQYFVNRDNLDPIVYTICQFFFVMVYSGIFALIMYNPDQKLTFANSWQLIYIGLFNTAVGFTIQTFAAKYISSARISIIAAFESVVGTVASVIIIGDPFTKDILFGGLLIFLAIIISETKLNFLKRGHYE